MSILHHRKSSWLLAIAATVAFGISVLMASGVYGTENGVRVLGDDEKAAMRGQGICAECEAVAATACPAVGNPCTGITCTLHGFLAGDGIRWCSGTQYTCTVAGLRKGCNASWSWWCNASSAGAPCGNKRLGTCFLGIGGCWCRATAAGACPESNCT